MIALLLAVPAPVALGGLDVVACASAAAAKQPCTAKGSANFSAEYVTLDADSSPRFDSIFYFTSAANMIAFENAPFASAPKYGGFCAHALSTNETNWSSTRLGPAVDLKVWRLVAQPSGAKAMALFASEKAADEFMAALPTSQKRADAVWKGWWGEHGTVPPYAMHAGPFNQACFVGGARDCKSDPQPLPPAQDGKEIG